MIKKIISIIAVISLVISLSACDTGSQKSSTGLTELTAISEETVKDKAILIVDGSVDNSRVENMLADYANKFNLDIAKVTYGSDWTAFENAQATISNAEPSENSIVIETLFSEVTDEAIANEMYNKLNSALSSILENPSADISEACNYVAEQLGEGLSSDDIKAYVEEAAKTYSVVLTGGEVDPLTLPQLIIFGVNGESGRIQAFSEYPEEFSYLATTKGLRNVEKTSTIKEVEDKIKAKETFVAVFTASNCLYCYNTYPLIRQKAAEYNIPVVEVNLSSNKNLEAYEDFMAAGYLNSEITGTPTTVYFKEGVLKDTQSGQLDVTKINSMFVRNK